MMNAWGVALKFMKLWELQGNPKAQIPKPKSQEDRKPHKDTLPF
jgi:hypothetical protein